MNLFDKFKRQNAAARLIEEQMYEFVVEELENGIRRNGLWAKALANSQGHESKAKALYITNRVQSLKDESEVAEAVREQKAEELQRQQQAKEHQEQQNREREANRKSEEAKEILKEKGYKVTKKNLGWLIIEPWGGRVKISTDDELFQYAISRKNRT